LGGDFGVGACLVEDHPLASYDDLGPPPPAGEVHFILVRAQNADGVGTYGGSDRDPGAATSGLPCHFGSLCSPGDMPQPNIGLKEDLGIGGCPDGMIPISSFCVDRYEASLQATNGSEWSPFHDPGATPVIALSRAGAIPQSNVSGVQAAAACAGAGKRLCTDAEWLRACLGPGGDTYPYGNTVMPGVCNDSRAAHPAVEYFGTTDAWIFSSLDHPCLDQLPDSVAPAGGNPGCVTAEGALDMMGNLAEWTSDPAGTFRGGYYLDAASNGPGCLWRATAHNTLHADYSTGFRCCTDP
jgi:sulfatase modifying factor 1